MTFSKDSGAHSGGRWKNRLPTKMTATDQTKQFPSQMFPHEQFLHKKIIQIQYKFHQLFNVPEHNNVFVHVTVPLTGVLLPHALGQLEPEPTENTQKHTLQLTL